MRKLSAGVAGLVLAATAGTATPVLAWNCPVQLKAAEAAITKAEAMKLSPEAKALLEESKKLAAQGPMAEPSKRVHPLVALSIAFVMLGMLLWAISWMMSSS